MYLSENDASKMLYLIKEMIEPFNIYSQDIHLGIGHMINDLVKSARRFPKLRKYYPGPQLMKIELTLNIKKVMRNTFT
jgi:hypothetical protein